MIQLDGRGYIKGTNQLYKETVITIHQISLKGNIVPVDTVIELVGAELVEAKRRGLVKTYVPEETKPTEDTTGELGPKKKRSQKKQSGKG